MLSLFLTILRNDFNLGDDIKYLAAGVILGQFFYFLVNKCSLRVFCVLLGNMVGFCFTNMLEICYFFTIPNSHYIEYLVPQIFFMVIANLVPFIVFDYFLSFSGAYFFIKGGMQLLGNDQIAEVKMFLAQTNFYTWENYQKNLLLD